jgi:hypothetical protein
MFSRICVFVVLSFFRFFFCCSVLLQISRPFRRSYGISRCDSAESMVGTRLAGSKGRDLVAAMSLAEQTESAVISHAVVVYAQIQNHWCSAASLID